MLKGEHISFIPDVKLIFMASVTCSLSDFRTMLSLFTLQCMKRYHRENVQGANTMKCNHKQ